MNPTSLESDQKSLAAQNAQSSQSSTTRALNTAMLSAEKAGSLSSDETGAALFALSEQPAFRAIVSAVESHAKAVGLSESDAALEIVRTFRNMDRLWRNYAFQQGVERIVSGS